MGFYGGTIMSTHTSRSFADSEPALSVAKGRFTPMLWVIVWATWTAWVGCHGTQYHVFFIDFDRLNPAEQASPPKIRRIELVEINFDAHEKKI